MLQYTSMKENQHIFSCSPFLNHGLISSFTKVSWLVRHFFLCLNTKLKTWEIKLLKESCKFYLGTVCQCWCDLEIWEIQMTLKKQASVQVMLRKKTWAWTLCHKRRIFSLLFTTTSTIPLKKGGKRWGNKRFTSQKYCENGKKTRICVIHSVEKYVFYFIVFTPGFHAIFTPVQIKPVITAEQLRIPHF